MLIPGFVVMSLVFIWPDTQKHVSLFACLSGIPYWCKTSLFLIISYIAGIINSDLTEVIWHPFRNNSNDIHAWGDAILKGGTHKQTMNYIFVMFMIYVIVTIVMLFMLDSQPIFILILILTIVVIYSLLFIKKISYRIVPTVTDYYNKYYQVEKLRPQNGIKIIESQVALIKNLCLPLCLWVTVIITNNKYCNLICDLFFLVTSLMIFIGCAVHRQSIVYRIVFEDYKYLKQNNIK